MAERSQGLEIGEVLKEARGRAGLEIGAVEERTKIRTRYLRALENEQWEVLPGHAYAKGFLRTYANLLGLDAEALLDEYRRRVEHVRPGQYGPPEPWTPGRRGADERIGGRRLGSGAVLVGVAGALLAILLVLGLTGGEEEVDSGAEGVPEVVSPVREPSGSTDRRAEARREAPPGMALKLVARIEVPVCLLDERGKPLLNRTLSAGEVKAYEAQSYELRLPGGFDPGQLDVIAAGRAVKLIDFFGPVVYEIRLDGKAGRPRELSPGAGCP